jgi:hypothetical protein
MEYNITQPDDSTLVDESNVCFAVRAMKQQMKVSANIMASFDMMGTWVVKT